MIGALFSDNLLAMLELVAMTQTELLTTVAYGLGLVSVLLVVWSLLSQSVSVVGLGLLIAASILMLIVELIR